MPIIRLFPQRIWLSLSILLCLPVFPRSTQAQSDEGGLRALFLLPETLGANYFLLRDAVEEYGWEVTQTAAVERITPCGFWGRFDEAIPLLPDQPLSAIDDITAFDCLVLAASPGNANPVPDPYGDIIASPPALELISTAVAAGLPVFTTCSGTRVLAAADVLRGRRVVGTPRFRDEYEAAGAEYVGNERNDTPPCISGNIITSARGQTYNLAQARAIATLIEDRQPRGGRRSGRTDHIGTAEAGFAAEGMVWSRTIGGSGADGARDLIATSDGGFLLTGYTFPPGASDADLLIVKTDAEGQIEWSRSFGGTGSEYGNACAEVADGYLVTGFTTSFGAGSRDLWVIRTDREGHEQWSRTFGGPSWEMGTSVLPRPDGHIVVCGSTHSFGAGEEDLWLLELGADGEQIRSRTYGGERIEIGSTVLPASDGGLLIAGTTLTYGGPNSDFWLLRTDAEGDTLWTRHYPARGPAGHAFDWCRAAAADARDGVLLVGYADCNDLMDTVVIRAGSEGDELWQRYYGANPFYDYGFSAAPTPGGGFVVAGLSKRMHDAPRAGEDVYDNEIALVKLSAGGDILWQRRFGGAGSDRAAAVVVTADGSVVLAGQTSSAGRGSLDVCLVKITGR